MAAGTISWFDGDEGYGWITRDDDRSRVLLPGREVGGAALVGDRVEFRLDVGQRGPEAAGVRVLGVPLDRSA